ncbi:META domain-containing protein, partial [Escherichia sp. TWPC-MK]
NRFSGEGKLSNGELTAKGLAMTRMMCANPQLNELDNTISEMLKEGAQVDLTANQLTLATAKQTLTYKLAAINSLNPPA